MGSEQTESSIRRIIHIIYTAKGIQGIVSNGITWGPADRILETFPGSTIACNYSHPWFLCIWQIWEAEGRSEFLRP